MASIFDMQREDPKKVVDQILHNVHSTIDVHFTDAKEASPRFSDTVFDSPEQTKILSSPDLEMETTITDTNTEETRIQDLTQQSASEESPGSRMIIMILLIILATILIFIGLSL